MCLELFNWAGGYYYRSWTIRVDNSASTSLHVSLRWSRSSVVSEEVSCFRSYHFRRVSLVVDDVDLRLSSCKTIAAHINRSWAAKGYRRVSAIRADGGNDGENYRNRRRLLQEQKRSRRACNLVSEAPRAATRKLWRRYSEMAG